MLNIRPVSDLRNKYPEIEQLMRQRRNSFFMIWLRHDLTASRHDLRRAHDFSLRSMNNAEGKSCTECNS